MNNFNFCVVEGSLCGEPSFVRASGGDPACCSFKIVSRRSYTKKTGEQVDEANHFNILAHNKLAEVANSYLKDGSRVLVSGNMRQQDDGVFIFIDAREINYLSPTKA